MIIEITGEKTIEEIRKEFSGYYPFLAIEFFDTAHRMEETSSYLHQYPHTKTIAEIRKNHNPGMLEIQPWHKTGFVEQEFRQHLGLYVQIMRHHGNTWIQTAGTDELTLEEQNALGASTMQDFTNRRKDYGKSL
jgi:hypothetical protein